MGMDGKSTDIFKNAEYGRKTGTDKFCNFLKVRNRDGLTWKTPGAGTGRGLVI